MNPDDYIVVQWHDDAHTILYVTFSEPLILTIPVQIALLDIAREYILSMPHIVHVILDLTPLKSIQMNVLETMTYTNKYQPQNMGRVAIVGSDLMVMQIARAGMKFFRAGRGKSQFFDSAEEALAWISTIPAQ